MFKDNFQFSREKLEFLYSIVILITIPVLLVANTLILSVGVRNTFEREQNRKVDLANALIAQAVKPYLVEPAKAQKMVEEFKKTSDSLLEDEKLGNTTLQGELRQIEVAIPVDTLYRYKVVASTDKARQSLVVNDFQFTTALNMKKAVVSQPEADGTGRRFVKVVSPIISGDRIDGLVASVVSYERSDAVIGSTLLRSLFVLGATVIVSVLLLLNHFRFVEYAMLFRKLKEVGQLKNDFLSVATHELRAPMAVIKGNIENLIDGLSGTVDDKGKQTLRAISEETDRLNNLITDLLNVSRMEQGRVTYNAETFDSQEIINSLVTQFTPKAIDKGLQISFEKPDQPTLVTIDRGRFTEVMTNLIDNAIKYSQNGTVIVSYKPAKDKIRISVRDTGIGMSAQSRERLFSRFYRVQSEQTKNIPGTGLGLWIIKQYIEHMGGTIKVDSLEGVGSEFIIEFPLPTTTQT